MKKIRLLLFLLICLSASGQNMDKKIKNRLLSFCRLYSTVKYYYPEPNLKDFPWDAFAYKGYEIAKYAKNDDDFVNQLTPFFKQIAPGVQLTKKDFDLQQITPSDTSLYPIRAFWQHQNGLRVEDPTFDPTSSLDYIYRKPVYVYVSRFFNLKTKELQEKHVKFSVWIKTEGITDSVEVLYVNIPSKSKITHCVKALGNEWKKYEFEFDCPKIQIVNCVLSLKHPSKGTVYVDNLNVEVLEKNVWKKIDVPNSGFEKFETNGKVGLWHQETSFCLSKADSSNAIEGKYCLKLPAIQEQILYSPATISQPYSVALTGSYVAYVPLQLYANDSIVFPVSNKKILNSLAEELKAEQKRITTKQQTIACALQIWAALYQDYAYRNADFERKINNHLFSIINKLETKEIDEPFELLFSDFIIWINDPHARIMLYKLPVGYDKKSRIKLPIEMIDLTKTQCVVTELPDSVTDIQKGDVVLKIGDINIDSLLQIYRKNGISRNLQGAAVFKMFTSYNIPELRLKLQRKDSIIDLIYTPHYKKNKYATIEKCVNNLKRNNKRNNESQLLFDSLKTKGLFYINCENPAAVSKKPCSAYSITAQDSVRPLLFDSLVMEINKSKALVLDARALREKDNSYTLSLLHALNERYGINIDKKRAIRKMAIAPVHNCRFDTVNISLEKKRDISINVPIYVLIGLHTHSAPELALLNLYQSGKAVFIGSNTSGAAGMQNIVQLADNIKFCYTTGKTVGIYNNPMSYQGTGIAPNIYVYSTAEGIREGRDEVLEKAVEMALSNSNKKP